MLLFDLDEDPPLDLDEDPLLDLDEPPPLADEDPPFLLAKRTSSNAAFLLKLEDLCRFFSIECLCAALSIWDDLLKSI